MPASQELAGTSIACALCFFTNAYIEFTNTEDNVLDQNKRDRLIKTLINIAYIVAFSITINLLKECTK